MQGQLLQLIKSPLYVVFLKVGSGSLIISSFILLPSAFCFSSLLFPTSFLTLRVEDVLSLIVGLVLQGKSQRPTEGRGGGCKQRPTECSLITLRHVHAKQTHTRVPQVSREWNTQWMQFKLCSRDTEDCPLAQRDKNINVMLC